MKYFSLIIISLILLNSCKKKSDESQRKSNIIVNTTVFGIGQIEGVHVVIYYRNILIGDKITDSNGKVTFNNVTPRQYHGQATYDSIGHLYTGEIPPFSLTKYETKEIDVLLR